MFSSVSMRWTRSSFAGLVPVSMALTSEGEQYTRVARSF